MKNPRKRRLSAWLLLSVFVPMLTLTLLHHHEVVEVEDVACDDCAHHVRHGGHFSVGFSSFENCLICEFASQTYVSAAKTVSLLVQTDCDMLMEPLVPSLPIVLLIHHSSRAPPAFA
ncbi:MAG: hypothetical protein IKN21_03395 [Prevotella sp.]|nr:hypothetical protein [Prevotella sp.]MBR7087048.1 hypothetical protein [Prevotella sp.]